MLMDVKLTAVIDLDMEENRIEFQDTIFTDCTNDGINLMHQIGSEDDYDGYETFIYNLASENGGYLTDFNWTGGSIIGILVMLLIREIMIMLKLKSGLRQEVTTL